MVLAVALVALRMLAIEDEIKTVRPMQPAGC